MENTEVENYGLENKDPFYGAIRSAGSETDYMIGGDELKVPKPRHTFHEKRKQYHQPDVSKVSCTVFGSMGALSDLMQYNFTLKEQKQAWKTALDLGANPNVGWYIHKAVDVVRKQYNAKNPEDEVMSFKVWTMQEDMWRVLDMGYSVVTGFSGNRNYNLDAADGILEETSFGPATYGHCIRLVKSDEEDTFEIIVDNYAKSKKDKNVYKVSRENLKTLIQKGIFFRAGYIFVNKKDFDMMNVENVIPMWGRATVQKCIAKNIKTDWTDWKELVGGPELEQALINLKVLDKQLGNVSQLRFYIAMDRMGNLDKL